MDGSRKEALVLSGGGAFGAYEVGVFLALTHGLSAGTGYRPFEPSIYTGTSAGAFNAAFLASRGEQPAAQAAAELGRVWYERIADHGDGAGNGVFRFRADPFELLDPWRVARRPLRTLEELAEDTAFLTWQGIGHAVKLVTGPGSLAERLVELFDFAVFVSTNPLLRTLRETVDFAGLRRSPRLLRIAATDWATGDLKLFGNHDMTDEWGPELIRGSASIPGIFPPQIVGPWHLVDGGVVMNSPLGPAIRSGADVLHVVEDTGQLDESNLSLFPSTMGSMVRAQVASWNSTVDSAVRSIVEDDRLVDTWALVRRELERVPRYDISWLDSLMARMMSVAHAGSLRSVTVHRYQPRGPMMPYGEPLAVLSFTYERIEELITHGYRDAIAHDCTLDGCLVPATPGASSQEASLS